MIPRGVSAVLALALAGPAATERPQASTGLSDRRTVVVFAPRADDPRLTAERNALATDDAGLRERDLSPLFIGGDARPDLRQRFGVPLDRFVVLLVGKDGHVAYRTNAVVQPGVLFARIDAMPMRRAEMRARGR